MAHSGLPAFLRPVEAVHQKTDDPQQRRYLSAFLRLRVGIGVLGIVLPFFLWAVDAWLGGEPSPRHSLSAYYYSGVGAFFVGGLCATGVFLVAYKVSEVNLDNTLSLLAGLLVILVAVFPKDPEALPDSPLQEKLGAGLVAGIHFGSAAFFISFLGILSIFFGVREARRAESSPRKARFWRNYHWLCAALIGAGLLLCLVNWAFGWGPDISLFLGETMAVVAFGASWLLKGFEWDMLWPQPQGGGG
jgi:hypothetical protein